MIDWVRWTHPHHTLYRSGCGLYQITDEDEWPWSVFKRKDDKSYWRPVRREGHGFKFYTLEEAKAEVERLKEA